MPRPQNIDLPLRSGDFDVFGHLNQAVYHELFEEARSAMLRDAWGTDDPQFVVARAEVDYRAEIPFGAHQVGVEMWPERVGSSSVTLASVMNYRGTVAAEGRFVLVAWEASSRGSRALTSQERRALEGRLIPGRDSSS